MFASISRLRCKSIQSDNVLFNVRCTGIKPRLPEIFDKYDGLEAEASKLTWQSPKNLGVFSPVFIYVLRSKWQVYRKACRGHRKKHFKVHRGHKVLEVCRGILFNDFDPKA